MSTSPGAGLPQSDMQRGQRLVRRFVTLNGVSVALLMDSMLILYAIRNGVGDSSLAVLASFIHLTMPFVLLGKWMIARIGAARTWGMGWILRSTSAGLLVCAPFLEPHFHQSIQTGVVLLAGFGFAAFRAVGMVGNSPVLGEITDPESRGRFMSGNFARSTMTQLLTLIVVIVLLGKDAATWVYQVVIGFGAALGFYNGIVVSAVPESDSPRRSAQKPLGEVLRRVWEQPAMRRLLFAWAASFAAFTLVLPFAIITLKNGYGLSDQSALTYSLIALCGGTVSGVVNGVIADHVGPRPLIVLYVLLLALVAVYWGFAPEMILIVPTGIAFFGAGYAKFGILMMSGHYFLSIAVESDRVGSSMVLRAISGAIAGLVGSIIGGGLLGTLNGLGLQGMETYRTYFRLILLAFLVLVPTVCALHRLSEWPLKTTALLHFRLRRIAELRRQQRRIDPNSPEKP